MNTTNLVEKSEYEFFEKALDRMMAKKDSDSSDKIRKILGK